MVTYNSKDVCTELNNHFINSVQNNINTNTNNSIFNPYSINDHIDFKFTDSNEILNIIKSLNKKSAVGHDNISAKFCFFAKDSLCESISKLINDCIRVGDFPDQLKLAKVTPIFKDGNPLLVNNYRPISVLPTFAKILERIIHDRLENHMKNNKIMHKNQFGFCTNSSTLSATSQLVSRIQQSLDDGKYTGCIFIDLRKAFDLVDHHLLLKKLEFLCLPPNVLKLLNEYFKERKQLVTLNNAESDPLIIKSGVPQGSLLGPLLFNFFVNDLFCIQLNGDLLMYADDMALFYKTDTINDLNTQMQIDIKCINRWITKNKLKMNETKTKYMIFETKNKISNLDDFCIEVNGHELERVCNFKYLGLWLDKKLNWERHVKMIKEKIRKTNFILFQMKNVLPIKLKYIIFHSHIMSSIRYLLPLWGTATNSRINEISRLVNKSLKLVKNLPFLTPSRQLYDKNILTMKQLITYETILYIHKIKTNKIKHNFSFQSVDSLHSYNTRQRMGGYYYVNRCRTTAGQKNLLFQGLIKFNELPDELKNETRIGRLKIKLKTYLFNH